MYEKYLLKCICFCNDMCVRLETKPYYNRTFYNLGLSDLSYNILLRLDGDSFQNVTSIKTL